MCWWIGLMSWVKCSLSEANFPGSRSARANSLVTGLRVARAETMVPRCARGSGIGNVLRPSRRQFRRNQVRSRNERRHEATLRVDHGFNPILPCLIKIDPLYLG
jgi:hypothetical protein